jgi:ABC-2 type transport system ATP-binding protein
MSLAQLGTRLHALVDPETRDPEALLERALSRAGVEARVERARPSLEDVFVAATRTRPS